MPTQQMLLGAGSVTAAPGQADLAPGTTSWTVPAGVTSVSVVCIGAGSVGATGYGGGGGGLVYGNNISVTPGTSISVQVPDQRLLSTGSNVSADAYFNSTSVLVAYGGATSGTGQTGGTTGGSAKTAGNDGGTGGAVYNSWGIARPGGGGGAAGYVTDGGNGGAGGANDGISGHLPSGGDGAGGGGGGEGSTGVRYGGGGGGSHTTGHAYNNGLGYYGGNNAGVGGAYGSTNGDPGGQGQVNAVTQPYLNTTSESWGHPCGGGAGGLVGSTSTNFSRGGKGAVRIMWPGDTRSYPSTNVEDE
tara:strand:+ start:537 stop:1442 length:906 start_codon:yes stop_codon:yes gene_type:complete